MGLLCLCMCEAEKVNWLEWNTVIIVPQFNALELHTDYLYGEAPKHCFFFLGKYTYVQ